jgi:hypothetical protein
MSKRGAKGEGGHILHLVFFLLREEHLRYGNEVFCMRMLEGGLYLSLLEVWSCLLHLFLGAILLQRGAHYLGRLIHSW